MGALGPFIIEAGSGPNSQNGFYLISRSRVMQIGALQIEAPLIA